MQNNETKKVKTIPDNYTSVTPWIISKSSEEVIEFITEAFDAKEIPNSRILNEEGKIIHVVVKIGNAMVMLFDSKKEWNPTPTFLNLYVEDIEKVYRKSLQLGALSVTEITNLWFGEKVCRIIDPFGNLWWINQRIEEIDFTNPDEVKEKASMPDAVLGIAYIQKTLNEALLSQKIFFENKYNPSQRVLK
ncbi:putative glyoxalase superfamily protein PhnB [Tenacibaculum adriaticum]|uniref:Putative glyoxalase superfamily protein PhnB n=1 Tax=Tenacibaculum adriaticum TaxID=413713 RepID=A0A5S5DTX2_9FLAO|nr:VOC family protein [Tenacibaculum adriaticum]TYP99114.1 putative glyoxalase superfamily protein PhnB [Tenacibaculum adriaticum]